MPPTLTQKQILAWGGPSIYQEAEELVKRGGVLRADYQPPWIEGILARGAGELRSRLRILDNGMIESHCPCWINREQGLVCNHVIALAIAVLRRTTDPLREQKYIEEQRRARRVTQQAAASSLCRDPAGVPTRLVVTLPPDWLDQFQAGRVTLACSLQVEGRSLPLDPVAPRLRVRFSHADENLYCVLEDMGEGRVPNALPVRPDDFLNVLDVCRDRALPVAGRPPLEVHGQLLQSRLRMDLDRETGELLLFAHTEMPFLPAAEFPVYCVSGRKGWAFGAGHIWPLERVLPLPYHGIYREPVVVPRGDLLRFLRLELPALRQALPVDAEIAEDLFGTDPATPAFRLRVRGSPASLAADLLAVYGTHEFPAGAPETAGDVTLPDPDDLLHYLTRNPPAEAHALAALARAGFQGARGDALQPITGQRLVLNFLGGGLPALRRLGWRIEFEGRIAPLVEQTSLVTPVVKVTPSGESNWFDVAMAFEGPEGRALPDSAVQRALLRGDAFLELDGQTILLDRDAVEAARAVFTDCPTRSGAQAGHFQVPALQAPYVRSALAAIDGIDIEDPPDWRLRAAQQNREARLAPVPLDPALEAILRPYQKDGVYWLRFLEESGFGGILADEMGLGKTLQTLAWLQLVRTDPAARDLPTLIVCPTSLVENWAREAQKFTPALTCLVIAGNKRQELWAAAPRHNLVVTSYALLRRDLDRCLEHRFAAAVLDEAHHIKNRSTQNAVAAKQIQAHHRLVLTGTPIENSVADLWSIMDFLMPGYLGDYERFRLFYEQPIAQGDRDGELAQGRLRRKLHPFLLRRIKRDVAKDLPEKIIKTSFCTLTPDQQEVYNRMLQSARQRIGGLVAEQGFDRSRMEILALLLRLRQTCCHLDLLAPELRPAGVTAPSAKLDQFVELLDEAIDGGHRMLVFSQFVSMLEILRQTLEARDLPYCYLDGRTRQRLAEVQRFNLQREIPVFLISLKAGGTGLNLTGADMVVHFDPWWNPAVEDQATDRAHRIGQHRTVYSIKLIAEHTVEEKVLALQQRKQALIQATVGTTDEAMLKSLGWSDIQELLAV